jgi:hypothetical protein
MKNILLEVHKFFSKTLLYIVALPVLLIVLGAASNQAVLIANHDKFPVMVNDAKLAEFRHVDPVVEMFRRALGLQQQQLPPDMIDDVHCIMTSKTHLNAMADIFDLGGGIYSIGDFGIILGETLGPLANLGWVILVVRKLYNA